MAQTVTVNVGTVNKAVWVGNAVHKVNSKRDFEKVFLATYLKKAYERDPNLNPTEAIRLLNAAQQDYNERVTRGRPSGQPDYHQMLFEMTNSLINVAGTLPMGATAAAVAKEVMFYVQRELNASKDAEGKVVGQLYAFNGYVSAQAFQEQEWGALYDLTRSSPAASQAVALFFSPYLNASTADSAGQIYEQNPEFAMSEIVRKMIRPDGSIVTTFEELKGESDRKFREIIELIGRERGLLRDVDEKQRDLISYLKDEEKKAAVRAKAEELRRLEAELKLEARAATLYILSTFVGVVNQKLGKAVGVAGSAAIQVADSINKYADAACKLGSVGSSLGGVILTGNMLGVAMSLISLFDDSPTAEQIILDEVGELRKQVASLRAEMHERFDRIDQSLNIIFDTLNEQFKSIDLKLGRLQGDVEEIQRALLGVRANLGRLERNLYSFLNAGFRRDLKGAVDRATDYRGRTGREMSFEVFEEHESKFFMWATDYSADELQAGRYDRSYTDEELFRELSSQPLDSNVNYLAELARNKFPGASLLAQARLASPLDWAISSEAYVRLAAENPGHFAQVAPGRVRAIQKVGRALQAALRGITVTDTPDGPRTNYSLFSSLVDFYKSKTRPLIYALEEIEPAFLESIAADEHRKENFVKGLNLWGGPGQPTKFVPDIEKIGPCGSAVPDNTDAVNDVVDTVLDAPEGYAGFIPGPYLMADGLGLAKIKMCYSEVQWADVEENIETHRSGRPAVTTFVETRTGVLSITIKATWMGKTIFERTLKSSERVVFHRVTLPEEGGAPPARARPFALRREAQLERIWASGETLKKQFAARSVEKAPDAIERAADLSAVSEMVGTGLRELQGAYYGKIKDTLMTAGRTHDAAMELSGAKLLLESFIALGLPTLIEGNDLLRALLYGEQRVVDEGLINEVCRKMMLSSASPGPDQARVDFGSLMDQRIDALWGVLKGILDEINEQKRVESYPLIEMTLRQMEVYGRGSADGAAGG